MTTPENKGVVFKALFFKVQKKKKKFPPFFSLMFPPTPPFFIYIISPRKRKRKKKERKRACTHVREAYFFLGDLCYKIMVRTYQLSTEIRVVFFFP